jgi:hypothetical protein
MQIIPELRTQSEILQTIKNIMRDTANNRWTANEIYTAINQSLDKWSNRVRVPYLYTITDGFETSTHEYTLPYYVRPPLDVQQKRYTGVSVGDLQLDLDTGSHTWIDVPAWELEPDGAGGQTLRLGILPYEVDGRVIWWGANGHVPLSVPNTSAAITTTTATSLTLTGVPNIGNAGFVKIDQEIIAYAGKSQSATITTLSNLVRGYAGTTAATHLITTPCYWMVAAHREDLFTQLADQSRAYLYSLFLTDAAPREIEHHTFQMRYWQQSADEFWKRYTPNRSPRMRLSREVLRSPR